MGTLFQIAIFKRFKSPLLQIVIEIVLAPQHENANNALVKQRTTLEFLFAFKYFVYGQDEQGEQKRLEQNRRMA